MPLTPHDYDDNSTFIPGYGNFLVADIGTTMPTVDEIKTWIESGATGVLGTKFYPFGHTSIDTLPKIESETSGGETKGSWENHELRTTPITTTDKISVLPIQWSELPLQHRFGGGTIDKTTGKFTVPDAYTSQEVAGLVIFRDGNSFLAFAYARLQSQPGESLDFSSEDFAALPVTYTVLKASGAPKLEIISDRFKDAAE